MNFIDEVTANYSRIQLAESTIKSAVSKTVDSQRETNLRVEKSKIREVCISDAISFNMLNIYTNLIMKPGYKFLGDCKEYDQFFDNMRNYGDPSSLRRLYKELHRDRAEYGAAFLEFIPFSDGYGIADLRRINASRIDYVRDTKRNIILDRNSKPYGFVMDFGASAKLNSRGDPVPKRLSELGFRLKTGQIYLKPERIAVFPLYRLENNYDYLGLIEPAYQDIIDRLEASQIQVNALKVKATSKPIITVGDATHEPTPQMMNDANFLLSNMTEADGIAIPKFMEISTLDYKSLDIIEKTIKMLLSSSAAASGTPLPIITGSGEETNRSTLASQLQMTISMLQSQVDDFVEDWNMLVMGRLKEENNFKGDCALVWEGIRYEDRIEELKSALEAFKSGAISSTEYRVILEDKFNWEFKKDFEKRFGEFIHLTKHTFFGKEPALKKVNTLENLTKTESKNDPSSKEKIKEEEKDIDTKK